MTPVLQRALGLLCSLCGCSSSAMFPLWIACVTSWPCSASSDTQHKAPHPAYITVLPGCKPEETFAFGATLEFSQLPLNALLSIHCVYVSPFYPLHRHQRSVLALAIFFFLFKSVHTLLCTYSSIYRKITEEEGKLSASMYFLSKRNLEQTLLLLHQGGLGAHLIAQENKPKTPRNRQNYNQSFWL